ncbi:hypothetical protein ACMGE5_09820 [Macrococcus equi]|uniref:hypothetical protein n=2 Tax=Macrococcus equi TaxID=3395462 RepID=UPI0039BE1BE7
MLEVKDLDNMIPIKITYLDTMHTETLTIYSYHITNDELILIHLIDNEFVKEYINLDEIEYETIIERTK